jgi:hypothetical protein
MEKILKESLRKIKEIKIEVPWPSFVPKKEESK